MLCRLCNWASNIKSGTENDIKMALALPEDKEMYNGIKTMKGNKGIFMGEGSITNVTNDHC